MIMVIGNLKIEIRRSDEALRGAERALAARDAMDSAMQARDKAMNDIMAMGLVR